MFFQRKELVRQHVRLESGAILYRSIFFSKLNLKYELKIQYSKNKNTKLNVFFLTQHVIPSSIYKLF